jgi:hypothetical protein
MLDGFEKIKEQLEKESIKLANRACEIQKRLKNFYLTLDPLKQEFAKCYSRIKIGDFIKIKLGFNSLGLENVNSAYVEIDNYGDFGKFCLYHSDFCKKGMAESFYDFFIDAGIDCFNNIQYLSNVFDEYEKFLKELKLKIEYPEVCGELNKLKEKIKEQEKRIDENLEKMHHLEKAVHGAINDLISTRTVFKSKTLKKIREDLTKAVGGHNLGDEIEWPHPPEPDKK